VNNAVSDFQGFASNYSDISNVAPTDIVTVNVDAVSNQSIVPKHVSTTAKAIKAFGSKIQQTLNALISREVTTVIKTLTPEVTVNQLTVCDGSTTVPKDITSVAPLQNNADGNSQATALEEDVNSKPTERHDNNLITGLIEDVNSKLTERNGNNQTAELKMDISSKSTEKKSEVMKRKHFSLKQNKCTAGIGQTCEKCQQFNELLNAKTDDTVPESSDDDVLPEQQEIHEKLSWLKACSIKYCDDVTVPKQDQHSTDDVVRNTTTDSILTKFTSMKCIKSGNNEGEKSNACSISTDAVSGNSNTTTQYSLLAYRKKDIVVKETEPRDHKLFAFGNKNVDLCCATESGAKGGRNSTLQNKDTYESNPFHEYLMQGEKGKKGPIYRGPPSSKMTKRSYRHADRDEEKTCPKTLTAIQSVQKTVKTKESTCKPETGRYRGKECTLSITGEQGLEFMPDYDKKYSVTGGSSRAAKIRHDNKAYIALMKAMEREKKQNELAKSAQGRPIGSKKRV